jgi:serine/threonine protein kinase
MMKCIGKNQRIVGFLKILAPFEASVVRKLESVPHASRLLSLPTFIALCYEQAVAYFPYEGLNLHSVPVEILVKHRATMCRQFLSALALLHRNHIAHGDVMPRNVVFHPDTGRLKVLDFGQCKDITRWTAEEVAAEQLQDVLDAAHVMTPIIESMSDIYFSPSGSIFIDEPDEIRVLREVVRDMRERKYRTMQEVLEKVTGDLEGTGLE